MLITFELSDVQKHSRGRSVMNNIDHFDGSDDFRYRHDLIVELYRVEQAQAVASGAVSVAELERLQSQQKMIRDALARLAA